MKGSISGYGAIPNKRLNAEISMSIELIPYFKLLKQENPNYTWFYYFSNNDFLTLYPFDHSQEFILDHSLKSLPLFQYSTPKLNKKRELFFTPVYMDTVGKGLMVTAGIPLYKEDNFLGVTEIDITLKMMNELLQKYDLLGNSIAVVDKDFTILGSVNLLKSKESKIYNLRDYLSQKILDINTTSNELIFVDGKYVYTKNIDHTPWKIIYIQKPYKVWINAIVYALPVLLFMFFFLHIIRLYRKTKRINKELEILKEKYKGEANHDYMTQAYNRRYFFDSAKAILLKTQRKKAPIAVAMCDIDDFKIINDTYGHDIGDEVIIEVKKKLYSNLRASDLVARFGGEEFCILLEDVTQKDAENLFQNICAEFDSSTFSSNGVSFSYTLSIGLAYGNPKTLTEIIKLSDIALYNSKENGKNMLTTLIIKKI